MYKYLGDKNTDPKLKNISCAAVKNRSLKFLRGKNGNMLVVLPDGKKLVVVGRLLKKVV